MKTLALPLCGLFGLCLSTMVAPVEAASFNNATVVVIPSLGAGSPYPSPISVSGLGGTINQVTVTLQGFNHTWPGDVDVLLVGPGGQKVLLMSDVAGGTGVNNVNLTLSDAASAVLPGNGTLVSGTFRPTDYTTPEPDAFASPAPAGPYATALAVFNGQGANGTWALYVVDDGPHDQGSLAGGWSLTITTTGGAPPTISDIADQSTTMNTSTAVIPFTIGDSDTPVGNLTVGGASSNQSLVPDGNIIFGGSGADRTVTVTPASGQTGSAIITVTVSDGALTASDTFILTVIGSLNADLLDGLDSTAFALALHDHDGLYWKLLGNGNTTPDSHFLGTTDNQPLELRANNQRALRLEPTAGTPNLIGGFAGNMVKTGATGVFIGGGGAVGLPNVVTAPADGVFLMPDHAVIGGGVGNSISAAALATIAGGGGNHIEMEDRFASGAFIGGGSGNLIWKARYATISGGETNRIEWFPVTQLPPIHHSTIGGGRGNVIYSSEAAVIGGGRFNRVEGNRQGTIGGGEGNHVGGTCWWQTIGGGVSNTNNGHAGTIAGGFHNVIRGNCDSSGASSGSSTIGGGAENLIAFSYYSTIAGGSGNAIARSGFFPSPVASTISGGLDNTILGSYAIIPGGQENVAADRSFAAGYRAQGVHEGSFVWADATGAELASSSDNEVTFRASGGTRVFSDATSTIGVQLLPGANAWSAMSDRNLKKNLEQIDCQEVLAKVAALPITTWQLKSQPASVRHMGPMAQDFKAAFGVGEDERFISTSDADGVALAAIQGLNQKLEEQIRAKDAELKSLNERLAELDKTVRELMSKQSF